MFRFFTLALCSAALMLPSSAFAHGAHVHGVGKLDVSLDGKTLWLHLDTPLANLVGFEHAPATAAERATVQAMIKSLRAGDSLFAPNAEAQCRLSGTDINAPSLAAFLGKKPAAKADAQEEHADLDADIIFGCARPDALRSVQAKLFAAFPNFHQVDVQFVMPQRQGAATLTPSASLLELR